MRSFKCVVLKNIHDIIYLIKMGAVMKGMVGAAKGVAKGAKFVGKKSAPAIKLLDKPAIGVGILTAVAFSVDEETEIPFTDEKLGVGGNIGMKVGTSVVALALATNKYKSCTKDNRGAVNGAAGVASVILSYLLIFVIMIILFHQSMIGEHIAWWVQLIIYVALLALTMGVSGYVKYECR